MGRTSACETELLNVRDKGDNPLHVVKAVKERRDEAGGHFKKLGQLLFHGVVVVFVVGCRGLKFLFEFKEILLVLERLLLLVTSLRISVVVPIKINELEKRAQRVSLASLDLFRISGKPTL